VRLAQQLLGLLESALGSPDLPERHRGGGQRGQILRADGLASLQREALGLRELALLGEQLREPALALAQRRPVLERGEGPDRLAEDPLGTGGIALQPGDPGLVIERAAERPGGAGFRQVAARAFERGLRLVQLAAVEV